ncbi:MAG: ROK family protein [Firmicutes bacterium]|nr:ROK family protein [Bacillota bacterium]
MDRKPREDHFLGIDVGNTKLAFAITGDNELTFHEKRVVRTEPELGVEQALDKILTNSQELLETHRDQVKGIGVAFGGFVNATRSIALASPNFPGWRNVPLVNLIQDLAPGIPIKMDNDANVAGVGEATYGKAQGYEQAVYLTVSTGVGGAVLFNGQPLAGSQGLAAEFGHMIVKPDGPRCTCGSQGCLEALASGTSIARIARERALSRANLMLELAGRPEKITARTVSEAARRGDGLAKAILEEVAFYLGIGLANVISAFDPDIVVMGGGVMNSADLLLPGAIQVVKKHLSARGAIVPPIEASSIHDDVALWGAIALAHIAARVVSRS